MESYFLSYQLHLLYHLLVVNFPLNVEQKDRYTVSGARAGARASKIDTPGLKDSNNEDTEHIRSKVEFFRIREQVNCFLVVKNGNQPGMI